MRSDLCRNAAMFALLLSLSAGLAEAQSTSPATTDSAAQHMSASPAKEREHPFAAMAGSWSGGGMLALSSGTRERLRCRAHHSVGQGGRSLALSIRCASDSYKFDLTSNVVNRRGRIFGRWSEASNGVSGTVAGSASGGRIRAVANGDAFSAGLAITTQGSRQTVTITPRETHITSVSIALRKR